MVYSQPTVSFPDSVAPPETVVAAGDGILSAELPADSTRFLHPNQIPYRTRYSIWYHALALPSTIWNAAWYPLGQFVIWMEQNQIHQQVINLFFNADRTAAIFPIAKIGGSTAFSAGVMAFHNNLFNRQKTLNFTFLFGSSNNNFTLLTFNDPGLFGSLLTLQLAAELFNDSDENYFPGGNAGGVENRTGYAISRQNVRVALGYPLGHPVQWDVTAKVERTDIEQGQRAPFGGRFPTDIAGFGTHTLGSIGTALQVDFRNGWPRTLSGLLLKAGYDFNSQFSDMQFQYHRYFAELQTFISPPFLDKNRRLALRARLEKVENITGKAIPFYALSMLGDEFTLRGFDQNRFRALGAFWINLEYRYPIYDTWDAVIFLDEGQVFDRFSQLRLDRFHSGAGFGFRFMTREGFLFRFALGFSREKKPRVVLSLLPNF